LVRKPPHLAVLATASLLCAVSWGLGTMVVGQHRLHPDEALYGYWGLLIARGHDPWLATVPVYKPPLLPYVLAGSLTLLPCSPSAPLQLRCSEWAVRLPGLAAGMLTVALSGRLARRLYRDTLAGLVATLVTALSPFAVLFSATGFIDPLMVVLGLGGCVAATERRAGWAGFLAGLALAAKQTGLVWLPLILFLTVAQSAGEGRERIASRLLSLAGGLLLVVVLVLAWDRVRLAQGAEAFWQTGVAGYGGLRMIWPVEWRPRLQAWLGLLRYLLGSLPLSVLLVGGAGGLAIRALGQGSSGTATRSSLFDLIWVGFCLVFLLLHWLWAFPVWDRYLLPLLPAAAILLGRVVALLVRRVEQIKTRALLKPGWAKPVALLAIATCLAFPAAKAVGGRIPVGAGQGAYDGVESLTTFLADLPEGSVLYHHWLGWEYAFYLFDAPLYLAYWPTPAWLARDVQAFGEAEPRYLTFPAWESSSRVEAALGEAGYRLQPVLTSGAETSAATRLTLFQVVSVQAGREN